jgi:hypothetical protein
MRHLSAARKSETASLGRHLIVRPGSEATKLARVGAEGTGAHRVVPARYLRDSGLAMVEVNRTDRKARRGHGKSDPLDAYAAARAVLSGAASVVPKRRGGHVERSERFAIRLAGWQSDG